MKHGLVVASVAMAAVVGIKGMCQDAGHEAGLWYEQDRGAAISDEGTPPTLSEKIILYPASRVGDFLDIFTFQFGFGFGLHLNGHATRAAQLGGGASAVSRLGIDRRHAGLANEAKAELSVLPFTAEYFKRQNSFGFYPEYRLPEDAPRLYTTYREYTGVGVEATAIVVNVGLEGHPLEFVDAVTGLVGIDLLADDYPRRNGGKGDNRLSVDESSGIRRIVIVPSRVVASRGVRLARPDGMGVYYHRFPMETHMGLLGGMAGGGDDNEAASEFSTYLAANKLNVHREMLERTERTAVASCKWDVVDVNDTLRAFEDYAVTKKAKGISVLRLPNYAGLAAHYGADAVLDVRVYEWGIWRGKHADTATMRLDCEFKLIAQPENKVLFVAHVISSPEDKHGLSLLEFAAKEGENLVLETRQACDVVSAQFRDLIVERH
jgi:hypothetical protein